MGGGVATVVGVRPTRCCAPLRGVLRWRLSRRRGRPNFLSFSWGSFQGEKLFSFVRSLVSWERKLLNVLVTCEEPTSGHNVCIR